MPEFHYKARDKSGQLVDGKRSSTSVELLTSELRNESLTPIKITPINSSESSSIVKMLQGLFKPKITTETLYIFSRQMYSLCKAGVPLSSAISRIAETTQHQALAEVLEGIAQSIAGGQKLASSMQQHTDIFPQLMVHLISIGEESGGLDQSFLQISNYLELEDSTVKQLKTLFRYPTVVITAVALGIIIINIFVIPNFAKLFTSFDTELPLPTIVLIAISNFLVAYWPFLLALIVAGFFSMRHYMSTPDGQLWWGKFQLSLPIFGPIITSILLARFAKSFAIITRAGLSINRGITLISDAVNNAYLKEKILYMGTLIDRGEKVTTAANATGVFSPLILQMLDIGEQTGDFSAMMEEVSDFYDREVDYNLKRVGALIEPLLLMISAGMVLVLALGVFLPMWDIATFANK